MPNQITSIHNPLIKEIQKLKDKKYRDETGLFLIEGEKELELCLDHASVQEVFCLSGLTGKAKEIAQKFETKKIPITEINEKVLNKIAYIQNPFPVIAIAKKRNHDLCLLKPSTNSLFLIAETIQKPGNIGAMLRVADGVGANGFIITDPLTDIYNPNVLHASRGVLLTFPIALTTNAELKPWLQKNNISLFAALCDAKKSYLEYDYTKACALIIGNESEGLTACWQTDVAPVYIPMHGKADSLNASTAAAILLYEAKRQRTKPIRHNGQ